MISEEELNLIEQRVINGQDLKSLAARVVVSELKEARKENKSLCDILDEVLFMLEEVEKTFMPENPSVRIQECCRKFKERIDKNKLSLCND